MTTGFFYVNIDLRHRYGISLAESQRFLRAKRPQRRRARRSGCFCRLRVHQGNMKWERRRRETGSILVFFPLMCACVLKISPFALAFLVKFSVHILMSCFLFCPKSTLIGCKSKFSYSLERLAL